MDKRLFKFQIEKEKGLGVAGMTECIFLRSSSSQNHNIVSPDTYIQTNKQTNTNIKIKVWGWGEYSKWNTNSNKEPNSITNE